MVRALVLEQFGRVEVRDLIAIEPAAGEVVLQIIATGICGSDIHGFTGDNGRRVPGQVMGHETVGRVLRRGEGVTIPIGTLATVNPVLSCGTCAACLAGQEQACPTKKVIGVAPDIRSAFAEELVVRASNVVPLLESVPPEHGALVEPLAVGYHALRRGRCAPDDTVLILGGGPIGQACVLAARRCGVANVHVSEPVLRRRVLVTALGATAIDPGSDEGARDLAELNPTLVIDAVGVNGTLSTALEVAGFGARIVLVGMGSPRIELGAYGISTQERSVIGSFCYTAAEFTETASWVGDGHPELDMLIEDRVDLEHAQDAFASLGAGSNPASKVLVQMHGLP